jgi:hypothetical protein
MARDKAKDDKLFNCSQEHEFQYVSGLYSSIFRVLTFLKSNCADNTIKNLTHLEVYKLIQTKLGFPIPI